MPFRKAPAQLGVAAAIGVKATANHARFPAIKIIGIDPGTVGSFLSQFHLNFPDYRPVRVVLVLHVKITDPADDEFDFGKKAVEGAGGPTGLPLLRKQGFTPWSHPIGGGYLSQMRNAMAVCRQPTTIMQTTNESTAEPGTTAGSHLQQDRNALESKTGDAREDAKRKAHQAYDDLRQGTRKIARESGSYLRNVVAEQQHLLVEKLEEYRDAAKAASEKLKSEDDKVAAKNIQKAAGSLECVTDYVRESEPDDLLSDASRMARKRPELVFGGLFLAGLGMARVMKASARERRRDEHSSNGVPSSGADDIRPSAGSRPGNSPTITPAASPAASAATIGA